MLDVLVLLIDKPGHRHQAEGVARTVARRDGARLHRVEVGYRWWAFAGLRAAAARRARGSAGFWLKAIYGIDPKRWARADLIVGSGRPGIAAGILLARHFGAPFVYSGLAKNNGLGSLIDLQLVSIERYHTLPNTALAPFPTLIDPDALSPSRRLAGRDDLKGARIGLLLGGDAHSHTFTLDEWKRIADLVVTCHAAWGARWRIFTSRRTGAAACDLFMGLAGHPAVETVVDWRRSGAVPPEQLFDADAIVVTEDSASMMYEAVAAGRPVVALRPAAVKPSTMDEIVAQLAGRRTLAALPIAGLTAETLATALVGLEPEAADPRDAIRAALAPVLPLPERVTG